MHCNRVCITKDLCEKVIFESHAPPYVGHRGTQMTMQAMVTYFYWPYMKQDVKFFVGNCLLNQKVKFDRHKAYGLLQPLPIPTTS